jgi:hypothetical protein
MAPPKLTRWARDFDRCRRCARTERRHLARGLCESCYVGARVKVWRARQKKKRRKAKR